MVTVFYESPRGASIMRRCPESSLISILPKLRRPAIVKNDQGRVIGKVEQDPEGRWCWWWE